MNTFVKILLVYLVVFTSGIFLAGHFWLINIFGGDESLAIISILIHLILIVYLRKYIRAFLGL